MKKDEKNTSRANQTRSTSERPKVWVPPSSLDAPPAPDAFSSRRREIQGSDWGRWPSSCEGTCRDRAATSSLHGKSS